MDDFNLSTLHESKSEWASRVLIILTPLMIEGFRSVFNEANKMCVQNEEPEKYLMTFQNLLLNIPKWSNAMVEAERKRIIDRSGCAYLEDLVTCVHITQLKILTAMRVGTKQKKINIDVPNLDTFIHKAYINVARKLYNNVYLYEAAAPLQVQKNHRELEIIIQEYILNTIRESIPVETILRAYMDETMEEEVTEEIKEEVVVPEMQQDALVPSLIDQQNFVPASTNPELNELREMQKVLSEEPRIEEPIMVDIAPLSRPPSVENLPITEDDENHKDKIVVGKADDEEVTLDFESL
jgi:hypothetical protein